MKSLRPLLFIAAAALAALPLSAQVTANPDLPEVIILPNDAPGADPSKPDRVVWSTEPGIRYQLEYSEDLEDWDVIEGFPSEAEALAQQHAFEKAAGGSGFFRVGELDEQPPEIVLLSPGNGAFGVGRFSAVTVELSDRTGIDPDSISLSIGGGSAIGISHPALNFEDGLLVYNLDGDVALGGYGAELVFSLTLADPLSNAATYEWSFELEREVEVTENLFVFGSPSALRAGQQLAGPAATVATRFGGPVRMGDPPVQWAIDSVTPDAVVISYTTEEAPSFAVGQKITNLAPAHVDQIFYREVSSVAVDITAKTVTLQTSHLDLPDIMPEGSFTFGENAELLEFDEDGKLTAMRSLTVELPSIGSDFSGRTVYSDKEDPDDDGVEITLPEARALFHPSVTISLETRWGSVERFSARAEGRFDIAVVPEMKVTGSYENSVSNELWRHGFWVWTSVGVVPVGVEVSASITANASIELGADATFRTGFRQTASMGLEGIYVKDASPSVRWDRWFRIDPLQQVPFTYTINGQGKATVSLVPQIDVRLYGTAGLYVNIDPRLELSGSASLTDGVITEASWLLGAYADVNAGLSLIGFENNQLPALPPFRFFTREWGSSYSVEGNTPLGITRQPLSQSARAGDTVVFAVEAVGTGTLRYQWYHNGLPLPNRTSHELRLSGISNGTAGQYRVSVSDDRGSLDSATVVLTLVTAGGTGPAPGGFARIPAGSFTMGRTSGDTEGSAPPVNVYVSEFYMATHEVTKALWDEVRIWGSTRGYTDIATGGGKAANHPVHSVNWWDVVKWCNARSERDGLTPVYTNGGNVMRSGTTAPTANWSANGYRLPTEAEWEKAARGGVSGQRFPWGDTISHSQANYLVYSSNGTTNLYSYDVTPRPPANGTFYYHPTYATGSTPHTAPVGSFAPNGYGLYDMAGNVFEWNWDWYSASTYTEGASDPKGAASGSNRVLRGGSWNSIAFYCRSAYRINRNPGDRFINRGFRSARSSVP